MQQVASSATQQSASSAEHKAYVVSGASAFKHTLIDELNALRRRTEELLNLQYSPETQYPVTTTYGKQLSDVLSTLQELKSSFSEFSLKQAQIVSIDKFIKQTDSTYNNIEMTPVVSDSRLVSLGYTKRFDIARNKFIFFDSSGNEVPAPV